MTGKTLQKRSHFCVLMDDWTLSWERRSNGIYLMGEPHRRDSTCVCEGAEINIWIGRLRKAAGPPHVVAVTNQPRTWTAQKCKCLLPDCLELGYQFFLPLDSNRSIGSSCVSRLLAFGLNYTMALLGLQLANFRSWNLSASVIMLGGAHWLKPPTLARHHNNHLHELSYNRRSW